LLVIQPFSIGVLILVLPNLVIERHYGSSMLPILKFLYGGIHPCTEGIKSIQIEGLRKIPSSPMKSVSGP